MKDLALNDKQPLSQIRNVRLTMCLRLDLDLRMSRQVAAEAAAGPAAGQTGGGGSGTSNLWPSSHGVNSRGPSDSSIVLTPHPLYQQSCPMEPCRLDV